MSTQPKLDLSTAIATFGATVKGKLSNVAAHGAPEDQLRAPLEQLIAELATLAQFAAGSVKLVGESTLAHLGTRPDYAVTATNALVGFIEVKAPGKGADPQRFTDAHDRRQWEKLKSLPNLIYTDGNAFSLWRDGVLVGEIVRLHGDIATAGAALTSPPDLVPLFSDFLRWKPVSPRSAKQLAEVSARLCRLLRDEVTEELERKSSALTSLAAEWRSLLFPLGTDVEFADGYAQAVTFGLLVARASGISLAKGIGPAALALRKSNSLIAAALRLLTDDEENQQALKTALDTLTRVLEVVDWPALTKKKKADAWLYFYEDFLEVYDNDIRKKTGSYYTPADVVDAMVRLVDEALQNKQLFDLPEGLASTKVTVADPAVGTGTYLLGVIRRIAAKIGQDPGPGAVGPAIRAAASRLIGFELQFGPFAVAQLRLIAEMQALAGTTAKLPDLRLFITDTLGDPYTTQTSFSALLAPIGKSRKEANAIKRSEAITVMIGNPPYKDKAGGLGAWIEHGTDGRPAPMELWKPPVEWGVSSHTHKLKNLYTFFWRWATWKVFGADHAATTGETDADRAGIICFITASGFLSGQGFQKMRADLRRDAVKIWVIDCSPEGHQPIATTRIFPTVQQPLCIVLAAKTLGKDKATPAEVRFVSLPVGNRHGKFEALKVIKLDGPGWLDGPAGWRDPFLPAHVGTWADFVPLLDLFAWSTPGVKSHRTWIIAPDANSLSDRWNKLQGETDPVKRDLLFHPDRDRTLGKVVKVNLGAYETRSETLENDSAALVSPIRYGFRSFDRQWLPPDHRLISQARTELWGRYSGSQIHLTSPEDVSPTSGPAVTITDLIPDQHHYAGRGGRAIPLWADAAATRSNVKPALLAHLGAALHTPVGGEDVLAYVAALLACPAFTARFAADLKRPGMRVPITADPLLFNEAVALGREVVWLHCFGERFVDTAAGRAKGPPRLPAGQRPTIPADGTIPGSPEPLPNTMTYDPAAKRLHIGQGYIDNVPQGVWDYEITGRHVLRQWFSYRKLDRSRPMIGDRRAPSPLSEIQPDEWLSDYTTDLMDLLNVLGRLLLLEGRQADLLDRVCAGPLLDVDSLMVAGALEMPSPAGSAPLIAGAKQSDLFGA